MKTHLEFAKIKPSKKLNTIFSGLMKLSSKHHVWRKPGTSNIMCVFQRQWLGGAFRANVL